MRGSNHVMCITGSGSVCSTLSGCRFFFFSSRRRHTRFDCDWSSDVCSSDLVLLRDDLAMWQRLNVTAFLVSGIGTARPEVVGEPYEDADGTGYLREFRQPVMEIGRASCRERV